MFHANKHETIRIISFSRKPISLLPVLFNRFLSYIFNKWTGRGDRREQKRDALMIFRLFILLIGFGLAVSGGISMIAYLNMITAGYGAREYLLFISKKMECYLLPGGLALIWISIYFPQKKE